ncbi:MAG: hypothetical protein RL264_1607 [Bacteroidota bacterium]
MLGVNLWEILFMIKRLYIITGAPNVRKSSVIRALTGVFLSDTFQIQFENDTTPTQTHVMIASPNEIKSTVYEQGMTIQQLFDYLNNLNENDTAVILPIRSVNPKFNLPVASEYIQALHNEGFEIAEVAMFNEAIPLPNGVQGTVLMSNENIPSNLTASKLRKIWGIV